ncbi:MAG: 6-phosphogluconolactonase [Candidatus Baltobacteraceae bacterium]
MRPSDPGDVVVVEDALALARTVAARFAETAARATAARGRFEVALAGGSTPKAAYALLAESPYRERVDWSSVRFFFGDERCVPPDDEESNYGMVRSSLLDPLGIDGSTVFRMRGEDEPQAAADAYQTVLRAQLGADPVFDLVMLGMGPEGHTASLFPGSSPQTGGDRLVLAPFVAKVDMYRLTLAPRAINAARAVQIATAGDAKADALKAALEGPFDPNLYPVQIVRPLNGALTWLVDRAAASKLTTTHP